MKNKEQHYVPKLFLRRFSINNNEKTIGVFNIKTKQFIANAPLRSQACKPYFYGRDGIIEAQLAGLEGLVAELLRKISKTSKAPNIGTYDWITLLVFLLSSELRTQTHIQKSLDMSSQLTSAILDDVSVLPKNVGEMNTSHEQAVEIAMRMIKLAFQSCYDLKPALIRNETSVPFITCDNPVIKYNQYLEARKQEGAITGYAQIGLQFFLPIDARTMILLYDSWVYKVGSKTNSTVVIRSDSEVNALNFLSVVNCDKVVYFNHDVSELYLNRLTDEVKKYPVANAIITKSYYSEGTNDGYEHFIQNRLEGRKDMLVHTYTTSPLTKLKLSFISETKQARKKYIDGLNFVKRIGCKAPDRLPSNGPFRLEYE